MKTFVNKRYYKNNITKVGEPKISQNGIMSEFSEANYGKTDTLDFSEPFELQVEEVVSGANLSGVFVSNSIFNIQPTEERFAVWIVYKNSTYFSDYNFTEEHKVTYRITYASNLFLIDIKGDTIKTDWTRILRIDNATALDEGEVFIGFNPNSNLASTGSFDLTKVIFKDWATGNITYQGYQIENTALDEDFKPVYEVSKMDEGYIYYKEISQAGEYSMTLRDSAWYQIAVVGGGGRYNEHVTGDWDGGFAYHRGFGGGSGSAYVGYIYLEAGTYNGIIGGIEQNTTFAINDTNIITAYHGTWTEWRKDRGGEGGAVPLLNNSYNFRNTSIYSKGNNGTTVAGDWNTGSGTGGASLYQGFGEGQSGYQQTPRGGRGGVVVLASKLLDYDYTYRRIYKGIYAFNRR